MTQAPVFARRVAAYGSQKTRSRQRRMSLDVVDTSTVGSLHLLGGVTHGYLVSQADKETHHIYGEQSINTFVLGLHHLQFF